MADSMVKNCVVISMVDGKHFYQPLLRIDGRLALGPVFVPVSPEDMVSVYREARDAVTAAGGVPRVSESQVADLPSKQAKMREQEVTLDSATGQELPPAKTGGGKDRKGRSMR